MSPLWLSQTVWYWSVPRVCKMTASDGQRLGRIGESCRRGKAEPPRPALTRWEGHTPARVCRRTGAGPPAVGVTAAEGLCVKSRAAALSEEGGRE